MREDCAYVNYLCYENVFVTRTEPKSLRGEYGKHRNRWSGWWQDAWGIRLKVEKYWNPARVWLESRQNYCIELPPDESGYRNIECHVFTVERAEYDRNGMCLEISRPAIAEDAPYETRMARA